VHGTAPAYLADSLQLGTGRLNARVKETACKHRGIESACKKWKVKLEVINSQSFKRRVKVAHLDIFNFLRHLSDTTTDLMTDVVRLEQHRRIKRRTPVKQRKSKMPLKSCTDKFCQVG